jgi:endonuclease YncB( thermonuclease family)|tara:strand:+ start:1948 stop:2343 length:396 start_codon:yes stop_codon:yes gene_type:complete
MSNQPYAFVYKCKLKSVTDGDTLRLQTIDLGFSVQLHNKAVRINGIDTPESRINLRKYPERAKEKELGLLAKKKLKEWLKGEITLRSYGTDKYGRVLGDIFCEKGNVAELLKKENLAVDYHGGTKTKKWGE